MPLWAKATGRRAVFAKEELHAPAGPDMMIGPLVPATPEPQRKLSFETSPSSEAAQLCISQQPCSQPTWARFSGEEGQLWPSSAQPIWAMLLWLSQRCSRKCWANGPSQPSARSRSQPSARGSKLKSPFTTSSQASFASARVQNHLWGQGSACTQFMLMSLRRSLAQWAKGC